MRISHLASLCQALAVSGLLLVVTSAVASADERFALAIGEHGDLVIFSPTGEKVADLPAPSVSQSVIIDGTTSFQASYGRDINNMLTAILAPNPTQPSALHLRVLNKNIDSDKEAVVTLTFSSSLNNVSVDPGFIGMVQVNSESVGRHATTFAPVVHHTRPATPAPRMNTEVAPRDLPPNSGAQATSVSVTAVSAAATTDATPATPANASTSTAGTGTPTKTYWPEPVTAPDGSTPKVAPNEMKLVCVFGPVTVKTPDGKTEDGANGMVIPSGSSVVTGPKASAAVFAGGVNSARLMPDGSMTVTQTMEGTVRHNVVDLQQGAVFSRVGRLAGETEKYEVHTPEGVAAARGTVYGTFFYDNMMFLFEKDGTVQVFDKTGQLVSTVTGLGSSHVAIEVIPKTGDWQVKAHRILADILAVSQAFDTNTYKALKEITNGGHPTDAEKQLLIDDTILLFGDSGGTTGSGNGVAPGNGSTPAADPGEFTDSAQTSPVQSLAGLTQAAAMEAQTGPNP